MTTSTDDRLSEGGQRTVGIVVFDGFDLLDVAGPAEIFGVLSSHYRVQIIGPTAGQVTAAQGTGLVATASYTEAPRCDLALVPGGAGTRPLVADATFLRWLGSWASQCEEVASVCTGSALLAAAGLLDGYRATTNKAAFAWATSQSTAVDWVAQARWVHDRDRWTSSGVAAGIDLALAILAHHLGADKATALADGLEIDWHDNPDWDPFAGKHGLV